MLGKEEEGNKAWGMGATIYSQVVTLEEISEEQYELLGIAGEQSAVGHCENRMWTRKAFGMI